MHLFYNFMNTEAKCLLHPICAGPAAPAGSRPPLVSHPPSCASVPEPPPRPGATGTAQPQLAHPSWVAAAAAARKLAPEVLKNLPSAQAADCWGQGPAAGLRAQRRASMRG